MSIVKKLFAKAEKNTKSEKAIDWTMYPARLAPGLFFLSTAADKLNADEETAKALHGMASVLPGTSSFDPQTFVKLVAAAELAIGGALVTPIVSNRVAGTAMAAFSAGLLGMYFGLPGMVRDNSKVRPSQEGTGLAKDVWLLGTGVSLAMRG